MQQPPMLACLFCVTAGQNGENLGSDEEQIVLICYIAYDSLNKKVLAVKHRYVKPMSAHEIEILQQQKDQQMQAPQQPASQPIFQPSQTSNDCILTEECKIQTAINEEAIKSAPPLDVVIREMETDLKSLSNDNFIFVTDGPLHLRMCLIPEATNKDIPLSNYYFRYFDLRKEVKKFTNVMEPINCLSDVLAMLEMDKDEEEEYGVKHCKSIAMVLDKILVAGHELGEAEVVKDKLEPGVCDKQEKVDEHTVVRARGLPWQSSDQDIARFFRGLNVQKGGVALCLSAQGRRNGEALIRFELKEHRDLALRKHKHHIGQRYIEVYKASGEDFIAVAGGNSTEAHEFLSRQSEGGCQIIIRMRGLPYVCSAQQVLDFFEQEPGQVNVLDGEEGVLFVHQADGRATGDAFVLFATEEEATTALTKHRQCIGSRYIELFKSTTAEVQQVLNRSLDPRANLANGTSCGDIELSASMISPVITLPFLQTTSPTSNIIISPQQQQLIASGVKKDCIRIRNLPLEAQVREILSFLGDHSKHIVYKGVHLVFNSRGVPSGEAFIQMDTEFSAQVTAGARNNKVMYTSGNKKHFIEVLQCSGDEMNLLLSNGLQSVRYQNNQQAAITVLGATNGHNIPILIPTHFNPSSMQPIFQTSVNRPMITNATSDNQEMGIVINNMPPNMAAYQTIPHNPTTSTIPFSQPPPPFVPVVDNAPNQQIVPPTIVPSFQPIVYWYHTPPISPQEALYIPVYPTTVLIKGLPTNTHPQDILSFLEGQFEMAPEVQMVTNADGRLTGEAYVTFSNRTEAERVINKHAGKSVGGRVVEMFIVQG